MELHLISVIMPAYNEEKYIGEAINSILNQTYENWELVVVDDGSTDSTKEIIHSYEEKDARIHAVYFDKNKGACAALNTALHNTKGEYICWLSADDRYKDNFFASSLNYIKQHPDIDMVFSKYERIDAESMRTGYWEPVEEYQQIGQRGCVLPYYPLVCYGNAFCACTVFAKAVVYNKTGDFNPKHPYAGDYDYMMRMAAYAQIGFLNEFTTQIRFHKDQVTELGRNDLDAIHVFAEMLYDDETRKSLFKKSDLPDCWDTICFTFENRIQAYANEGREKEAREVYCLREEFAQNFKPYIKAQSYIAGIADCLNKGEIEIAKESYGNATEEVKDFADSEQWILLGASILEAENKIVEEKEVLEGLLAQRNENYEAHYMLGIIFEKEGDELKALRHYCLAAGFNQGNTSDTEALVWNLKRFLQEKL